MNTDYCWFNDPIHSGQPVLVRKNEVAALCSYEGNAKQTIIILSNGIQMRVDDPISDVMESLSGMGERAVKTAWHARHCTGKPE